MPEKLSDYVMRVVAAAGVRDVFMLPGGGAMHLNDSLGRCPGLRYVTCLHEQAAAVAAENYAKMTGGLGACLVTSGPGGTNTVTGVAGAWLDSTPCIFISGQVKRPDLKATSGVRQVGVQEVDIVAIVGAITKYAVTVLDPADIRFHLEKALHLARTGRPGPVWLDIPLDVQGSTIEPDALRRFEPEAAADADPAALRDAVAATLAEWRAAERPVFLAGNGIRLAGAVPEFLEVIDRLGCPVLATWLAVDLVPDDHPLYIGRPGSVAPRAANFTVQNADWLLTVGARLDMVLTAYAPHRLARGAAKTVVDIDPPELAKLKPTVKRTVLADAKQFFREMLRQLPAPTTPANSAWLDRCRGWKRKWPVVLPEHRDGTGRVSTYHLADVLSDELAPGDLIVSGSSGAGIEIFQHALRLKAGQRLFHTTALGAMGFGIPAAIGACVGSGGRPTVCVDGDGGFQMNIQELETVRRLGFPVKFFVLNNDGYSSIRTIQAGWFDGRLVGADATSGMTLPDVRKVAEAYGVRTAQIPDRTDLAAQVRAVLATPGPVVCEVMSVPDETREPRVVSARRADGSMVSKPLEDLFPFLDRDEFRANMSVPLIDE